MTTKRTALKVFRIQQHMTQAEFAEKAGINRSYYSMIESGKRKGTQDIWDRLQKAFNIDDAEMWNLTKIDEKQEEN